MIINTRKAEYDAASNKLFVINARLATALNKILLAYDNGTYVFQAGEEAIFKVPPDQIYAVAAIVESFK